MQASKTPDAEPEEKVIPEAHCAARRTALCDLDAVLAVDEGRGILVAVVAVIDARP